MYATGQWPERNGKEDKLKLIAWSPQSPDLNMTEVVWDKQDRKVKAKMHYT